MDIWIRYRTGLRDKLTGVTGDPTEVDVTIRNGFYRDIFALDANFTGLNYPGENATSTVSTPITGLLSGGIVPVGPVTIAKLADDAVSKITISSFEVSVSDEIAHAALRQVEYQEGYWAFPVTVGGVSMNCMFRKAIVDGWCNADDDN